jgi:hypothetical protein
MLVAYVVLLALPFLLAYCAQSYSLGSLGFIKECQISAVDVWLAAL